jgi:hypothetical protein
MVEAVTVHGLATVTAGDLTAAYRDLMGLRTTDLPDE